MNARDALRRAARDAAQAVLNEIRGPRATPPKEISMETLKIHSDGIGDGTSIEIDGKPISATSVTWSVQAGDLAHATIEVDQAVAELETNCFIDADTRHLVAQLIREATTAGAGNADTARQLARRLGLELALHPTAMQDEMTAQTYREFRGECECDWPDEVFVVKVEMDSRAGCDILCGRCDRLVPEDLVVVTDQPATFVARVRATADMAGEYTTTATLRV